MEVELQQWHHQLHHLLCVFHKALLQFLSIANLREGEQEMHFFLNVFTKKINRLKLVQQSACKSFSGAITLPGTSLK